MRLATPAAPITKLQSRLTVKTGYMKAVKAALQEAGKDEAEVKAFEQGAQKFVKEKILANFKDWEFYTGESMNPDGM